MITGGSLLYPDQSKGRGMQDSKDGSVVVDVDRDVPGRAEDSCFVKRATQFVTWNTRNNLF